MISAGKELWYLDGVSQPVSDSAVRLSNVALLTRLSFDNLCHHDRCMGLCLELFHRKTDLSPLEDEHNARKELWCDECSLPCRHPVNDLAT